MVRSGLVPEMEIPVPAAKFISEMPGELLTRVPAMVIVFLDLLLVISILSRSTRSVFPSSPVSSFKVVKKSGALVILVQFMIVLATASSSKTSSFLQ